MKNGSLDEVLSDNPIAQINTEHLILLIVAAVGVGYLLTWFYKDKYDVRYLIRAYLLFGIVHLWIGLFVIEAAAILVIGSYLLGGVFAIFRSNHYFYS
ncbi:hypothetical protein [Enterococcus ureasiticus]|uniref:Uncharacterized protein n=1 Tax=Enterococcus ureasiticus TaxID=903984 RepID=A0A1E5GMV9_9ENTE|nr:hypothetical protein [Enterococcus ureasiticus]OEG14034.1 hypothetical protein BCR21_03315 [Enterococcus ureasiticus]